MGLQYRCTNTECCYPGTTRFEMHFKTETIMDSNNLAATFCPFCKQEMMASIYPDIPAISESIVQKPPQAG